MSKDIKQSLEGIRLLSGFSREERETAERACSWKRYRAEEQIIDRDSDARDVFFVVSGKVRIVNYSLSGREVTLGDVSAGGHFGELAALDGEPRSASVMALEDTVVATMSPDVFIRLIQAHPESTLFILQSLSRIVRRSTERIMDLSTLGANNRVHAELLRLARAAAKNDANHATLSPIPVHSDIASRVSTTRETVARVLNELAREGIVKREKDSLKVLNIEALEDMVIEVRGE
ncbi:MAG: Crp/Fnr family transcriptional regulator [Alphaproteobacteria bacterium]|nr:Crp/Fnr family transcriptional regulator [Alphaproteobacteria bacterium]